MKQKNGQILKVIPGMNPNCSSGMFVIEVLFLGGIINIVTSIINAYILNRKKKKVKGVVDILLIRTEISKAIKVSLIIAFIVSIALLGLFWSSLKLSMEDYNDTILEIAIVPLMALGLMASTWIGGKILIKSKNPWLLYIVMPLLVVGFSLLSFFITGLILSVPNIFSWLF